MKHKIFNFLTTIKESVIRHQRKIFFFLTIFSTIIGGFLNGRAEYQNRYPVPMTQEEIMYYTDIANKVWNDGLSAIENEENNFELQILSNTKICIYPEQSNKGYIYFDFSNNKVEIIANEKYIVIASIIKYTIDGAFFGITILWTMILIIYGMLVILKALYKVIDKVFLK